MEAMGFCAMLWIQPQMRILTMPMPKLMSVPMTAAKCEALPTARVAQPVTSSC